MRFFGLFWAKMTKIGIPNPKLNVTNDYQQFLAHFEWFLSLFQIYDVKPELSPVKLKVLKNGIFWAKNLFQKNWVKTASKWVFIGTNHGICRVNFFNIDFDLKFGYCLSRVTQKYLSFEKIPRFSAPNSPLKF